MSGAPGADTSWPLVLENCSLALQLDPDNWKALTRRGLAHSHLTQDEEAEMDLRRAASFRPLDGAAARELEAVRGRLRAVNSRLARGLRNMFL